MYIDRITLQFLCKSTYMCVLMYVLQMSNKEINKPYLTIDLSNVLLPPIDKI